MTTRKRDTTKKDQLVGLLREAILSGEIAPGEKLVQEEIAARYKVSPTPVREAIQQLVAEGVLSQSPYRGVRVVEVNLADAREIYLIRGAVEALATRCAVPNLRLADVAVLKALQNEIEQFATQSGTPDRLIRCNYDFHMTIYRRAEMPQLEQIIRSLWLKSPWDTLFVIPGRAECVVGEHQRILAAIEAHDAESAGAAMGDHIEQGRQMLESYLEARAQDDRT